jgi:hypothetical protein
LNHARLAIQKNLSMIECRTGTISRFSIGDFNKVYSAQMTACVEIISDRDGCSWGLFRDFSPAVPRHAQLFLASLTNYVNFNADGWMTRFEARGGFLLYIVKHSQAVLLYHPREFKGYTGLSDGEARRAFGLVNFSASPDDPTRTKIADLLKMPIPAEWVVLCPAGRPDAPEIPDLTSSTDIHTLCTAIQAVVANVHDATFGRVDMPPFALWVNLDELAAIAKRSAEDVQAAVGLIGHLLETGQDHANLFRVWRGTQGKEGEVVEDPTVGLPGAWVLFYLGAEAPDDGPDLNGNVAQPAD